MISLCQRHDFIIRKAWTLSRLALRSRASLIHRYGKVSFATIVATSFMRSITSFAVRQHRFPTANENDICAFGAKWCSSLRSEIRPYGSRSPFPQGKADGYRSSLICGIHYSFSSRVALLTPQALLFSVHCPLSTATGPCAALSHFPFPFSLIFFPFPSRSVRYPFLIFNFQLSIFN